MPGVQVRFDGATVVVAVGASAAVFIGQRFVLGLARRLSKERSREEAVPR